MGWLLAPLFVLRVAAIGLPVAATFVIVTALLSGVVESEGWRWLIGAAAALAPPLVTRWRLGKALERRKRHAPGRGLWLAFCNVLCSVGLALGFADDVGRALRRHGDWFVGERNGAVARGYRAVVGEAAGFLEKWDPAPEFIAVEMPPPLAPPVPGQPPPPPPPPVVAAWFHPLAGPRDLPRNESQRFGAARPQPRPPECELGHCGVDLAGAIGTPVYAIHDGFVQHIERDETRDTRAGRYLEIVHKDGTVVSHYLHLDSIEEGLKEGDRVSAGQAVARLGRSGVFNSGPHLHFALSMRGAGERGRGHYIDPEPYLRTWRLPSDARVAVRETDRSPL